MEREIKAIYINDNNGEKKISKCIFTKSTKQCTVTFPEDKIIWTMNASLNQLGTKYFEDTEENRNLLKEQIK